MKKNRYTCKRNRDNMKRIFKYRYWILFICCILFSFSNVCYERDSVNGNVMVGKKIIDIEKRILLYDDVWGSIYNAEKRQCDNTPLVTGSGFKINPAKASDLRVIAISHEMLNSPYRAKLINNPESKLYKGKISYGDTIYVESPNEMINGYWVVHDTKNPRYRKSVDFLQTKGDATLYNNDPLWNGKFENIKIYKVVQYQETI